MRADTPPCTSGAYDLFVRIHTSMPLMFGPSAKIWQAALHRSIADALLHWSVMSRQRFLARALK